MIDRIENHTAFCRCRCGRTFSVALPEDPAAREIAVDLYAAARCPDCENESARRQSAAEADAKQAAYLALVPELIVQSGIPAGYRLDPPPVRVVAAWLWEHRTNNILLSGRTGSGKSTSACCVASRLIAEHQRVRYCTLRRLLADWCAAKTGKQYAAEELLTDIGKLDLLIIDEMANKANISMSGQELLFELLEGCYSGVRPTRLWLLGNFYRGAVADIFADPDPVLRRIRERFVCAVIDGDQIKPIAF
ncbi:ATP-binding protein [Victivallis sp. Marseille-Q1083]|uniref:ATP-binding protein n=1 Tax=Victivallis sp. Marseille-Q1083 TaxID=2717288 RepID=UPI00158A744F|nr:ATP-binding protein [Victivallis sp. Marseille-Q1083]